MKRHGNPGRKPEPQKKESDGTRATSLRKVEGKLKRKMNARIHLLICCSIMTIPCLAVSCLSEGSEAKIVIEFLDGSEVISNNVLIISDRQVLEARPRLPEEVGEHWKFLPDMNEKYLQVSRRINHYLRANVGTDESGRFIAGVKGISFRHPVTGDILFMYVGKTPIESDPRLPGVPVSRLGGVCLYLLRGRDSSCTLIDCESRYYGVDGELPSKGKKYKLDWAGFDFSGRKICYWVNNQAFIYDLESDERVEVPDYNMISPVAGMPYFLAYKCDPSEYSLLDSSLTPLQILEGPIALAIRECFLIDTTVVVATIQTKTGFDFESACFHLSFAEKDYHLLYRFRNGQVLSARYADTTTTIR